MLMPQHSRLQCDIAADDRAGFDASATERVGQLDAALRRVRDDDETKARRPYIGRFVLESKTTDLRRPLHIAHPAMGALDAENVIELGVRCDHHATLDGRNVMREIEAECSQSA